MDQDTQSLGNTVSPQNTQTMNSAQPVTDAWPQNSVQSLDQKLKDIFTADIQKQEEKPSFEKRAAGLEQTRKNLDQKIVTLEGDIRQKLANLKALRAAIEEEMKKMKELKETEQKIDSELEKIRKLEK